MQRTSSILLLTGLMLAAQEPAKKYKPADMTRPRPTVIQPGDATTAPSDAIVLFNGKDLAAWKKSGKPKDGNDKPEWTITPEYFEVTRSGSIETRETFGDAQLHIEWMTPKDLTTKGQQRGNSGIKLGGFGEVQILESLDNDTYPDGQAGSLYRNLPPLVNASRKAGEWQTYDILLRLPRTDAAGKVMKPGLVTVLHNGVVVHHGVEFDRKFGEYSILLQDHRNPVRFRNVWVRKLKEYDEK